MLLSIDNIECDRSYYQKRGDRIWSNTIDTSIDEKKNDTDNRYLKIYLEIPTPVEAHLITIIHKIIYEENLSPHVIALLYYWLLLGPQWTLA